MKLLGFVVGVLILAVGVVGVVAPYRLLAVSEYTVTPRGLYVVGAVRVIIGLVVLQVSSRSRAPKTLRVLGIVALIAGLITFFLGVDRARAILDWWLTQGPTFMRLWAVLPLVFGAIIVWAMTGRRAA